MNRCLGCENVERELDADLLCSWCVERRDAFRKGEKAGKRAAFAECAEEARRRAANGTAALERGGMVSESVHDLTVARILEAETIAAWAERAATGEVG